MQPEPETDLEPESDEYAAAVARDALEQVLSADGAAGPPAVPRLTPIVDGEAGEADGEEIDLREPATGEPLARVRLAGPDTVLQAVAAASRSLALWRSSPFEQRARALRRLSGLLRDNARDIAQLIAREQGKPFVEAMNLEVLATLDHLNFMIQHAERYHAGLEVDPRHPYYAHKRAHYLYDAIGVVALVTPAPLPFSVPMIQVAAALAMGNAVILKPSERAPLSGLKVGELCLEAGFPAGLVNVVPATPAETLRLVAHPSVAKVFFTGSLEAGQHIMATAGCAPRPVVLSLGGKHASIVAGDADLDRAARGVVWGAMSNCGQNCGAIERVFVEESVASTFLEKVLARVDELRVGNPLVKGVDVGPMHSDMTRRAIHRMVKEAVEGGARLLRGGSLPEGPGTFYPPTVLLDPPLDGRLMTEEAPGPVLPIVTVDNLERAILLANETEYALTASGWTRSTEKAERMMVGLQAGVVTINDVLYSFGEPASTWSGYKQSGLGQNHGRPGLREMSRQRFVSFDTQPAEASLFSFPYDDESIQIARRVLEHLHGAGRWTRWRGLFRLVRSARFRARVPVRWLLTPGKRHPK